ncbi:hypothetical protein CYMTET_42874 [Cymbomonas tetramitiformis]|uniref:Uncharacterized protein n=1 Tax=Cymbomonas tetramitiformis TaxID=36881 RepID=A0AAE0C3B0_9CHLO|nr:hypothetical protein CYMTET_42874 [Cymbomonas tetramitiformis]
MAQRDLAADQAVTKSLETAFEAATRPAQESLTPESRQLLRAINDQIKQLKTQTEKAATEAEAAAANRHRDLHTGIGNFHESYRETGAAMVVSLKSMTTNLEITAQHLLKSFGQTDLPESEPVAAAEEADKQIPMDTASIERSPEAQDGKVAKKKFHIPKHYFQQTSNVRKQPNEKPVDEPPAKVRVGEKVARGTAKATAPSTSLVLKAASSRPTRSNPQKRSKEDRDKIE